MASGVLTVRIYGVCVVVKLSVRRNKRAGNKIPVVSKSTFFC